jgi:hypothetical protein
MAKAVGVRMAACGEASRQLVPRAAPFVMLVTEWSAPSV